MKTTRAENLLAAGPMAAAFLQAAGGPGASASEALLDVLYAGLEGGHLVFQLGEVALEDLAPAALVGDSRLDPAQGMRDGVMLLLESVESPVDLVEVPEHVASKLGELAAHLVEPTVDLGELASEEFDELLVLRRGHDPCVSQFQAAVKCVQFWAERRPGRHRCGPVSVSG